MTRIILKNGKRTEDSGDIEDPSDATTNMHYYYITLHYISHKLFNNLRLGGKKQPCTASEAKCIVNRSAFIHPRLNSKM